MPELLAVLRGRRGQEVSSYKLEIFSWSVRRRMSQLGVRSVVEYWDLLLPSDVELDALIRELLIGTTSFFRDGKPW